MELVEGKLGFVVFITLHCLYCRGTTSLAFKVEEYMEEVERWFRVYEMSHNKTKRQIYLATDDAKVLVGLVS